MDHNTMNHKRLSIWANIIWEFVGVNRTEGQTLAIGDECQEGWHFHSLHLSPRRQGVDENTDPSGPHRFKPSTVKHAALCACSYDYSASTPVKGQGPQKSKEDLWSQIYQFFIFKLQVILCCFFCHWFLNNVSADEPDGQTRDEHPNIRHKHSDPIASVSSL